jgi:hypothetical protein
MIDMTLKTSALTIVVLAFATGALGCAAEPLADESAAEGSAGESEAEALEEEARKNAPAEGPVLENDAPVGVIKGGKLVGKKYPALLAFHNGSSICSGTKIGPRTILTAAHCVSQNTPQGLITAARHPGYANGKTFFVVSGRAFNVAAPAHTPYVISKVTTHPSWNFSGASAPAQLALSGKLDLAIIETTAPIAGYGVAKLDDKKIGAGTSLTPAGYGRASISDNSGVYTARYFTGKAAQENVKNYTYIPGPNGTLFGDSGGPVFFGDSNVVVGVNSYVVVNANNVITSSASVEIPVKWAKNNAK